MRLAIGARRAARGGTMRLAIRARRAARGGTMRLAIGARRPAQGGTMRLAIGWHHEAGDRGAAMTLAIGWLQDGGDHREPGSMRLAIGTRARRPRSSHFWHLDRERGRVGRVAVLSAARSERSIRAASPRNAAAAVSAFFGGCRIVRYLGQPLGTASPFTARDSACDARFLEEAHAPVPEPAGAEKPLDRSSRSPGTSSDAEDNPRNCQSVHSP